MTLMLSDEILSEPIGQSVSIATGIATFGARDLFNFFWFFVGLMNLLVTRLYMGMINDFVTRAIESFFKLGGFIEFLLDFQALKGFFAKIKSARALAL